MLLVVLPVYLAFVANVHRSFMPLNVLVHH